jgi:hypothetical protein
MNWLYDYDQLPCTWAGAFYSAWRALLFSLAYVATLALIAVVFVTMLGLMT